MVSAMTDIVERLREMAIRWAGHAGVHLWREAADEIERLRENAHYAKGTIERLETENEQWRKLNSQRVDEIAGLIHRLRDRPRDDGTVVAVSGEPGASAGKSE